MKTLPRRLPGERFSPMGLGAYFAPAGDPARDLTRSPRLPAWTGAAFGCFGFLGSRLLVRFFLDMCLSQPVRQAQTCGPCDPARFAGLTTGLSVDETTRLFAPKHERPSVYQGFPWPRNANAFLPDQG